MPPLIEPHRVVRCAHSNQDTMNALACLGYGHTYTMSDDAYNAGEPCRAAVWSSSEAFAGFLILAVAATCKYSQRLLRCGHSAAASAALYLAARL